MKKSTLYYTGTGIAWSLGFIWSALIFLGYYRFVASVNKHLPFIFPSLGFVFIFMGIFFANKGSKAANLEEGKPANAVIQSNKTHKAINYIVITLYAILVIAVVVRFIVTGKFISAD